MTVVVAGFAAAHTGDPSCVFVTVALAGLFQVIIGVLKLGKYINYIPYPVISGFMSGIGIIILFQVSQLIGQPALKSPIEAISVVTGTTGYNERNRLASGSGHDGHSLPGAFSDQSGSRDVGRADFHYHSVGGVLL